MLIIQLIDVMLCLYDCYFDVICVCVFGIDYVMLFDMVLYVILYDGCLML